MAGGSRTLETIIAIRGNVDSSFSQLAGQFDSIGTTLTNLGAIINPYSQKLIRFGKESVGLYADYDDLLRKIQSVGQFDTREMEKLDAIARQYGRTSRYTAEEAGEAELILAQVGMGYKDIAEFLPSVLKMAQAGDMSIANSTDYLYSSLKSLGLGIDYADVLVDQMAKTAAVGSTDIDTLGESMTRIGSALSLFKGGSKEVLTILSAMSEFGPDMRGSEAGTQLRNFMLSLAAPTGNKKAVLAMLENVGASMEELDAILEDVDLASAAATMKEIGFDPYQNGELAGGIDLITGLRDSLGGLDEEARNNTLGQIFGKRTLTTAMNLMSLTDEQWNALMADIEDSEGFAQFMADTQEGGLGGAMRLLNSQIHEMKTTIGGDFADTVASVAGHIGNMATWFSGLDSTSRGNWEAVFTTIAVAGPGLLAAGGFFRMLGWIFHGGTAAPVVMGITLAAMGLATIAQIMHNIQEAEMTAKFGDMELDMQSLATFVDGLETSFSRATDGLGKYNAAVAEAFTKYEETSALFSSDLLTAQITGMTLTEDDKKNLNSLGDQMLAATLEGMRQKKAGNADYFLALFSGSDEEGKDALESIIDTDNEYFTGLYGEFQAIGQELRDKLTEALRDSTLDGNENESIMATVARLNEIQAQIASAQNQIEFEKLLHKGQSVSLDSLNEYSDMVLAARDAALLDEDEAFADRRASYKVASNYGIEQAASEEERARLTSEQDQNLASMDEAYAMRRAEMEAQYVRPMVEAWDSILKSSDFGELYAQLSTISDEFLSNGQGYADIGDIYSTPEGDLLKFETILNGAMQALGGGGKLDELISMYQGQGMPMPEWLSTYERLLNAQQINQQMLGAGGASQFIVPGDTAGMTARHEALQMDLTADASQVQSTIAGLSGSSATVNLDPNDSAIRSQLSSGYSANVRLKPTGGGDAGGMTGFAEGGRTDETAIFGEDGAEWAIPEKHDERTADLLISAAGASGFTWSELLDRTGGLNSDPSHMPTQLIYAPVIHAGDAKGVEDALEKDKRRFTRWWDEEKSRSERVEYR